MASLIRHDFGDLYSSPKIMQRGYGLDNDVVFYGFGVGTILKSYLYQALPYLKKFGKSIGREFLRSANEISANDSNAPLSKLIKQQGKKTIRNLGSEAIKNIDVEGEGRKRRKPRKKIARAFDFKSLNVHLVKPKHKSTVKKKKSSVKPKVKKRNIIKSKKSKIDTLF